MAMRFHHSQFAIVTNNACALLTGCSYLWFLACHWLLLSFVCHSWMLIDTNSMFSLVFFTSSHLCLIHYPNFNSYDMIMREFQTSRSHCKCCLILPINCDWILLPILNLMAVWLQFVFLWSFQILFQTPYMHMYYIKNSNRVKSLLISKSLRCVQRILCINWYEIILLTLVLLISVSWTSLVIRAANRTDCFSVYAFSASFFFPVQRASSFLLTIFHSVGEKPQNDTIDY